MTGGYGKFPKTANERTTQGVYQFDPVKLEFISRPEKIGYEIEEHYAILLKEGVSQCE